MMLRLAAFCLFVSASSVARAETVTDTAGCPTPPPCHAEDAAIPADHSTDGFLFETPHRGSTVLSEWFRGRIPGSIGIAKVSGGLAWYFDSEPDREDPDRLGIAIGAGWVALRMEF